MKLIVNADDFGLSRGTNLAIIEAFQKGIVRSTTMMVTMPWAKDATDLAKANPGLGVGVHLTLSAGKPINGCKSLTTDDGVFYRKFDDIAKLPTRAIEKEFKAQVERFISFGLTPTHLDTHHHVHKLDNVYEAVIAVAKDFGLPIRTFNKSAEGLQSTQAFYGDYYCRKEGDEMGAEHILSAVESHSSVDSLEVMCHPAFIDQDLVNGTSYLLPRAKELETLCSAQLKQHLEEKGITLCHFGQL